MTLSLEKLKRYIGYTESYNDFTEIFAIFMNEISRQRMQNFFEDINVLLKQYSASARPVGNVIDYIKNKHEETTNEMLWRDVKLISGMKIEYEFERLITQLKINREATMQELLNRINVMTVDEIRSFI